MIYYFYLLIGLILGLDQNTEVQKEVLSVCLTALNTNLRYLFINPFNKCFLSTSSKKKKNLVRKTLYLTR